MEPTLDSAGLEKAFHQFFAVPGSIGILHVPQVGAVRGATVIETVLTLEGR
jgi:hypothetical protein